MMQAAQYQLLNAHPPSNLVRQ